MAGNAIVLPPGNLPFNPRRRKLCSFTGHSFISKNCKGHQHETTAQYRQNTTVPQREALVSGEQGGNCGLEEPKRMPSPSPIVTASLVFRNLVLLFYSFTNRYPADRPIKLETGMAQFSDATRGYPRTTQAPTRAKLRCRHLVRSGRPTAQC